VLERGVNYTSVPCWWHKIPKSFPGVREQVLPAGFPGRNVAGQEGSCKTKSISVHQFAAGHSSSSNKLFIKGVKS
jgi:hypothetical protein